MRRLAALIPLAFVLGCTVHVHDRPAVEVAAEPEPVVIEEPAGPPVIVEDYYFYGGRYYYWHPERHRYVVMRGRPPIGYSVHSVRVLPSRRYMEERHEQYRREHERERR